MRICIDLDGPIAAAGIYNNWWKPEHWADLQVVPGARAGIAQLIEDGHQLSIVTARAEHPNTYQWLGKHDIHLPINHTASKWKVPANVYLDDSVSVLQGLRDRRLTCVKWVTKNNIGAAANFSVSSWPDFVALIRSGRCHGKLRRRPLVVKRTLR